MKALALLVLAAALLQGCGREPSRSSVVPPSPPQGFDAPVAQAPVAQAPVAPAGQPGAAAPLTAPPVSVRNVGDPEGAQLLAQRQLVMPVMGVQPQSLRNAYDQARGGRVHEAIDIMAPAGTPVVAVEDGRIAKLFTSKGGGLTIYQFDPQEQLAHYYAHLERYAEGLREGMRVRRGEVIGYVGSSGNADPAAPHLHFAVFRLGPQKRWWEGSPVNPYPVLRRAEPAPEVIARR